MSPPLRLRRRLTRVSTRRTGWRHGARRQIWGAATRSCDTTPAVPWGSSGPWRGPTYQSSRRRRSRTRTSTWAELPRRPSRRSRTPAQSLPRGRSLHRAPSRPGSRSTTLLAGWTPPRAHLPMAPPPRRPRLRTTPRRSPIPSPRTSSQSPRRGSGARGTARAGRGTSSAGPRPRPPGAPAAPPLRRARWRGPWRRSARSSTAATG
mmetsp:Transcript_36818/g.114561  ORF Transcript_36818/g.114561 Transcript_36818/m.114561 type:complete len:206 (-) Transcript_36818:965-1582(-)